MELMKIQPSHVSGSLDGESLVLKQPDTKTSSRKFMTEVILCCPLAWILLSILIADLQPGRDVFAVLSPKTFRSCLQELAAALKPEDLVFTPHSLRTGSARHRYKVFGSFVTAATAGRW